MTFFSYSCGYRFSIFALSERKSRISINFDIATKSVFEDDEWYEDGRTIVLMLFPKMS